MKCVICGQFSSAQTCFPCESSPVFLQYASEKLRADQLTEQAASRDAYIQEALVEANRIASAKGHTEAFLFLHVALVKCPAPTAAQIEQATEALSRKREGDSR